MEIVIAVVIAFLFFKATFFILKLCGKVLGIILSLCGYVLIGIFAVVGLGCAVVMLPVILIFGVIGLIKTLA